MAGDPRLSGQPQTGPALTLKRHEIAISMDGKGRCIDNVFVERLRRSLKYEEVYLNAYASVAEAKAWDCRLAPLLQFGFYNEERQHQSLGYRTPRQVCGEGLWKCSPSPTYPHTQRRHSQRRI